MRKMRVSTMTSCVTHLSGFHTAGDCEPSVLAVHVRLDSTADDPACTAIVVGSPLESTLMPGGVPRITGFCCDPETAEALAHELQVAAAAFRAAVKPPADGGK